MRRKIITKVTVSTADSIASSVFFLPVEIKATPSKPGGAVKIVSASLLGLSSAGQPTIDLVFTEEGDGTLGTLSVNQSISTPNSGVGAQLIQDRIMGAMRLDGVSAGGPGTILNAMVHVSTKTNVDLVVPCTTAGNNSTSFYAFGIIRTPAFIPGSSTYSLIIDIET